MSPSRLFILRPVATTLFMVAILLSGLAAYRKLAVSALPEVDYPIIQVITFYPGASSEVMASAVTAPLERQFGQVPGLAQMTSTSSGGSSVIVLQFTLDLNIDVAEQEVQAAINAAQTYLPQDLPAPPIYSKSNPADTPILTLALTSKDIPLTKVEDLADTRLVQKISQLPDVGLVSISGGQRPAVRIQANPLALSSYGLNMEDLRTSIQQNNLDLAKGNFDGPEQDFQIDANDQVLTSADYKKVVVSYKNGSPIFMNDVANVVDSAENIRQAAWMNKVPAVIVNVQRQPGANIIKVVDSIKTLLPTLKSSLPESIQLSILTDRTTTIRASVEDVEFELGLTIALVVIVIFIFLRNVPATIIPSIAVPLSLIGTLAVMYLAKFSLNNLTLMALTISTGFVVDDAIVMIENITRYIEEGEEPLAAALKGAQQIGFTIISLTISLIAVLIPLLLMGDIVGRLFREFAITLSVTILFSALISLTLTPMMCARFLKQENPAERGWFYNKSEAVWEKVIGFYGHTLDWVLGYETLFLLIAVGTFVLTVVLYIIVPKGFFPIQDTGVIQGISEAPQGTSFAKMSERQQQLVDVILKDPGVDSISSFIGADGTNTVLNSGRIQMNLKPLDQRKVSASEIILRLQKSLAVVDGITLYMQPVQDLTVEDRVSRTQYQYTLESPDQDQLNQWTKKFVEKMKALPELRDVATDQQDQGLAAAITIDRVTASRLGISPTLIDNTLYDAFGQRQVSTLYTQLNQYHVVLETLPEFQQDPHKLDNIYVRSGITPIAGKSQAPIPLSTFTHMENKNSPLAINHQGQFPVVTISFNLAEGASLSAATSAIEKLQKDMHMPVSIQAEFQGSASSFKASLANEPILILAALVTVYIVLGILYESFIHPITILSTLPSAGVGACLAMLITGSQLNVVSLIGIILLIGIVKKNGIMMIDFALEAERKEHKPARAAIYDACLLRFRPIMMTTMAALLAGLPLALGGGIGSELRKPLGIAMVGGLLVSQVLTLYTTPVIYIFFNKVSERFSSSRATAANPNMKDVKPRAKRKGRRQIPAVET